MTTASPSPARPSFATFYREVFLPEHQHPLNVALHIAGTVAGLAWIPLTLAAPGLWKFAILLFPLVHGAPGLMGHRLLERNAAVGDARWRRTDFSPWMFILANHRLTAERLLLDHLVEPLRALTGRKARTYGNHRVTNRSDKRS
jgi:hypothetical protein